ncbi:MAG: transcriptional repressor [Acholeplasmatales bacterium]|nr:transcriptional repressor [Acholeplasmatales bacterium]
MSRDSYNTKSREVIKEEIKKITDGFTIKELKNVLDSKNIKIGLTTIYRTMDILEYEGIVKKFFDENNIAHYKYVNDCSSERHFYLKCSKCEKIYHVDCSCIDELSIHIMQRHKFMIDTRNIILSGICDNCRTFIKF